MLKTKKKTFFTSTIHFIKTLQIRAFYPLLYQVKSGPRPPRSPEEENLETSLKSSHTSSDNRTVIIV